MIIFINTRIYPPQRRYIELAYNNETKSKKFINIENYFIHCDNQNVPETILKFVCWLGKCFELGKLILACRCYTKVVRCLRSGEKQIIVHDNLFSVEGMLSHLAKRYKTANRNKLAANKLSILVLIYDQLVFNKKIKCLQNKYNEVSDTLVIFNGRVSPENLADKLWKGKVKYVEQGFWEPIYYNYAPPVSKKRWSSELANLSQPLVSVKSVPSPKNVVLFLTSPYEFMFADEDFKPSVGDFQSQYDVIKTYVKICEEMELVALVKFHPRNPRANFLTDHMKSEFPFEFVETKAEATDVIRDNDLIVLSSSSLAIDAALARKPNCHCLPAFYEKAMISQPTKNEIMLRRFMENPFFDRGAANRAKTLRKRFQQSSMLLDEKASMMRYVKKFILGH